MAITGTSGRVGRALADRLAGAYEVTELPRARFDLARDEPARALADLECDALFNPAGLTSLEACEDDPGEALRANVLGPAALAAFCAERGVRLVHFSTDYVFDGLEPGWKEESHPTAPLSVYGRTKRQGEETVLAAGGAVVRVSWVFGPEKPAFPDSVAREALAGRPLRAVADKFSLPTFTKDLADWMERLLAAGVPAGVFHACNRGDQPVSWHDLAQEVVAFLAERRLIDAATPVEAVLLAEVPAFRAPRPRHTAMSTGRLAGLLGGPPRDWRIALREHLGAHFISR